MATDEKQTTAQQDAGQFKSRIPDIAEIEGERNEKSENVMAPSLAGPSAGAVPASELEGKTKAELVEMAEARGLTVTRGDGEEGEPVKQDYIDALSR
jgi:hypothetical protein